MTKGLAVMVLPVVAHQIPPGKALVRRDEIDAAV
jgi:hypothetical protein